MWNFTSLTRARTCVPFIGKPILNHRITRKVPLEGITFFPPPHAPLKYTALGIFWQTGHSFAFYSHTLFEDLNGFYQKLGWRTGLQSPWQPIQGNQTQAWVLCLAGGLAYGFGKEVFAVVGSQPAIQSSFMSCLMWTWKWSLWNNWASKRWWWGRGGGGPHLCLTCLSSGKSHSLQAFPLPFAMHTPENRTWVHWDQSLVSESGQGAGCPIHALESVQTPTLKQTLCLEDPDLLDSPLLCFTLLPSRVPEAVPNLVDPAFLSLSTSFSSFYAHTYAHTHTHAHTEFKPPLKITSPSEEVLILSVHLLLPLSLATIPGVAFSEILPVFMTKWLQRCWGVCDKSFCVASTR